MALSARVFVVAVALGSSLLACADGGTDFDSGAADLTIEREGQEPLRLIHDPELSQVTLTPPTEGLVELVFAYQDPLVTFALRVNGDVIVEGDEIALPVASPLTADDLAVTLDIDEIFFTSDDTQAAGTLRMDVLEIDEDADYADVIVTVDVTLVSPAGDLAVVFGTVEARVGERDEVIE